MSIPTLYITAAGRQANAAADGMGTLPLRLTEVALGTARWTPVHDDPATELVAEIKRIATVGGSVVDPGVLHVTISDASTDEYALGEFGLYTDTGVLFAVYSHPDGITDKAADAILLEALDIIFTSIAPGSVTVGDAGFNNPPASETVPGVAELATQAEATAGTDDARTMTPLKSKTAAAAYTYTADQALPTPANTGTLAQLFSWFAGLITGITGKTDWKTAPATTLEAAATHASQTAPHSATSAATANRLMMRDAGGRAKVAAPVENDDIARKDTVEAAGVPAGCVAAFAFNSPPPGWLKANGAAISRTTYATLFAAIGTIYGAGNGSTTFNLPDMRGEFIRGWDDGRGVDAGRAIGSAQGDAMRNLTGHFTHGVPGGVSGVFGQVGVGAGVSGGHYAWAGTYTDFSASRQVPTAAEFRSRSIAQLLCIKY